MRLSRLVRLAPRPAWLLVTVAALAPHASAARAQETGSLLITCPAPCQVRVDGQDVGEAPAIVPGLLPGQHLVEAAAVDGSSYRDIAEVTPGRSVAFEVPLEPPPEAAPTEATGTTAAAPTEAAAQPREAAPAAPIPTAQAPAAPSPHPRGRLTPPPLRWNGGYRQDIGGPILLYVLGGLGVTGGIAALVHAQSLPQSHADHGLFTIMGGSLVGTCIGAALIGLYFHIFDNLEPAPSDEAGTVYFGRVAPFGIITPEGAVVGGRIRW